jgi:D-serine deaminase-like pyridoxal phosphate-dependent protein
VYPERIEENIKKMIAFAGGPKNLRPHIKTHKIAEIIHLQLKYKINKFKCATIAEAELLAICGAKDILFAMQPVGRNISRFFELIEKYPSSNFSTLVDNYNSVNEISKTAKAANKTADVWLDINNGMNRTGIIPDMKAVELFKCIAEDTNMEIKGLHVYDGHIHNSDLEERTKVCNDAFQSVIDLKNAIEKSGLKVDKIVAGGTPTFPIHCKRESVETSPGTSLLWDEGYGANYKDLDFLPAAVLITRVISKPKSDYICLDLGHKSVAPEMALPRVKFLNIKNCEQVSQSEEHLVLKTSEADKYTIGDVFYAIPYHICPTVAKYNQVLTVENEKISGSWVVAARDNSINI